MVDGCVNPECRKEFRLVNGGELYAYERAAAATEFFWLCASCAQTLQPYLDRSGEVRVRAKGSGHGSLLPRAAGHLRIVAAGGRKMSWRHSVPAGESHSPYWMSEQRERDGTARRGRG